jgi:hypothetical protein
VSRRLCTPSVSRVPRSVDPFTTLHWCEKARPQQNKTLVLLLNAGALALGAIDEAVHNFDGPEGVEQVEQQVGYSDVVVQTHVDTRWFGLGDCLRIQTERAGRPSAQRRHRPHIFDVRLSRAFARARRQCGRAQTDLTHKPKQSQDFTKSAHQSTHTHTRSQWDTNLHMEAPREPEAKADARHDEHGREDALQRLDGWMVRRRLPV